MWSTSSGTFLAVEVVDELLIAAVKTGIEKFTVKETSLVFKYVSFDLNKGVKDDLSYVVSSCRTFLEATGHAYRIDSSRPIDVPLPKQLFVFEETKYRSLIGILSYSVELVRPDAAYAVRFLARKYNPTHCQFRLAKRILTYLFHTRKFCLLFSFKTSSSPGIIKVFLVSD